MLQLWQLTPVHETKPSDPVETSVTNDAADDAIDNAKDDDKDDDNSAAEDSPSAPADEDCADAIDDAVMSAAASAGQRVSTEIIQQVAMSLTDSWLKVATRLHFQQDDIVYIQTEHSTPIAQATNMLTLWTVSSHLLFHSSLYF